MIDGKLKDNNRLIHNKYKILKTCKNISGLTTNIWVKMLWRVQGPPELKENP